MALSLIRSALRSPRWAYSNMSRSTSAKCGWAFGEESSRVSISPRSRRTGIPPRRPAAPRPGAGPQSVILTIEDTLDGSGHTACSAPVATMATSWKS